MRLNPKLKIAAIRPPVPGDTNASPRHLPLLVPELPTCYSKAVSFDPKLTNY